MGNKQEEKKEEIKVIETVKEVIKVVEKKEEINEFDKKDEIPQFNKFKDEINYLMVKKKKVLETQLYLVKENMKNYKDINDIIEKINENEEESLNNKFILNKDKDEKYCGCSYIKYLNWNFNFIGLLFVIFNLIGVYQLIWLFKATGKEMTIGVKSFLFNNTTNIDENTNSTENFDKIYENYMFNTVPDFNLFFLTSIIGNLALQGFGFTLSSIIYMIINSVIIIFFKSFDFENKIYDFYKVLLLFLYYILIFISVGSISLFAHQIYFDGLTKYIKFEENIKKNNDNEKEKINIEDNVILNLNQNLIDQKNNNYEENKENKVNCNIEEDKKNNKLKKNEAKVSFFSYLCFTIIPAYLINIGIKFFLKEKKYFGNYFLASIIIYVSSTSISIIIYFIYSLVFEKGKKTKQKNKKSVFRICGYLIYFEKKIQRRRNKENIIDDNIILNKDSNAIKNNDNIDNNNDDNDDDDKDEENNCCYSFRLGLRKFYNKASENEAMNFSYCLSSKNCEKGKCCYCCCCCNCFCSDIELSELNQGDEQFCYCYKVQRKFSWFCDLLFKNNILDLILFDIFLEILTNGFERKLNTKLEENDFIANFIILMIYLILFLIFSYINRVDYLCSYKSIFKNKNNKKELDDQVKNLIGIGFLDFIFVTIFSGFSSFGKEGLKNFTNNFLIIIPYALTKYYYFVLMNCLVNIIDSGNVDLLSN